MVKKSISKHSSKSGSTLSIGDGLRYPWGAPSRLWNILWVLIPILGWLSLAGYGVKIARSIIKGNKSELPPFGRFWENFGLGFWIFVRLIPVYIVVIVLQYIPFIGWLISLLIEFFLLPYLVLNTMMKQRVGASFELNDALKAVTKDFIGYLIVILKTIIYYLVYALASIILIGIPCLAFGGIIYYAEWYSKHAK